MKPSAIFLLFFLFLCIPTHSQTSIALLPLPNHIEFPKEPSLTLEEAAGLYINSDSLRFAAGKLRQLILEQMDLPVKTITDPADKKCTLRLLLDPSIRETDRYILTVSGQELCIQGKTPGAVYYGVITLEQWLKGNDTHTRAHEIAAIRIDDKPRFAYRGLMLDPARHFLPVEDVKRFIDRMSKYKYNILQLHLTDDEGWRIEIKKHPRLTEIGACRKKGGSMHGPDNGFYTQEQLKELIRYAADRNVEIVPEIDLPGHTTALLAAYPDLACQISDSASYPAVGITTDRMVCAGNERLYTVLQDILAEIFAVFPSKYIHLGGDESALQANWSKCIRCRALMKKEGYTEARCLMKDFFDRLVAFSRLHHKQVMLWCELNNIYPPATDYLFDYPEDVILFTWRNGLTPTCMEITKKYNHRLIMAPGEYAYLNRPQQPDDFPGFSNWKMPVTRLEGCYEFDPGYGQPLDEQNYIEGITGTLWGEAIENIDRAFYMAYPRALALAEAGWTKMEYRNWHSFRQRASVCMDDLRTENITFFEKELQVEK